MVAIEGRQQSTDVNVQLCKADMHREQIRMRMKLKKLESHCSRMQDIIRHLSEENERKEGAIA